MNIAPFALERYFASHEFGVPYLLCASDCETRQVDELLALEPNTREHLLTLSLGYTESQGAPELRAAIAAQYEAVGPEKILVHSGAEEAIFNFMVAVLDPGDHLIVHAPGYQSLHEVARSQGCDVSLWMAHEENGWALDLEELRRLLRPDTRAVVINTPHNPTGWLMPQEMQAELLALSQSHGFLLFFDEVYRGLEYNSDVCLPAICDRDDRAVSLGVMSKSYGLPGLRIGWIATRNQDVLARMAAFKDYTTICSSAPSEYLATLALRHGDILIGRNRDLIRDNLALLHAFFARWNRQFRWQPPKAGPIAFPGYNGSEGIETFCTRVRSEAGVLLLPGTVYTPNSDCFRVGFGRANAPESIARLDEFLSSTSPG